MKEFRGFRLDAANQCLWRRTDGGHFERLLLKPKPYAILKYLIEHAGRLVTQDELLDAVWPDVHVQPDVLKRHILDIRVALGDDPRNPAFIETLPRRGYRLVAPIRDDNSDGAPDPAGPAPATVVGRARELAEIRAYVDRMLAGRRQLIFVSGEPGIGKTALIDEFQRGFGSVRIATFARGQCIEGFGGMEAYYPILQALETLCRGTSGDALVRVLASHAPTWLVQFPSLVTREQREQLSRELLGATRERMLREIREALETIANRTALLLVLEDLQWADPSTADLLSALARGRTPAKLMIIGTLRPVDASLSGSPLLRVKQDLLVHQLCHEIALEPLNETHVLEYLSDGTSETPMPIGLPQLVHRHSGGNPLFMVATIDHMIQRGFIARENGRWQLNLPIEEIDLEVPEDLRGMIEARIERLDADERSALEAASVCGVSFTSAAVANASSLSLEDFEELCENLARRQNIVRWAGAEQIAGRTVGQRYEFTHALYREVFYRRQTMGRRAKLHLRIGESLEELFSADKREVSAELSEHFEQARDLQRAIKYLGLAADLASRRFAHDEGIAMLERAVGLVGGLPEPERAAVELETLEQLASFYIARANIRAATATLTRAIDLASQHCLIDGAVRALVAMALPASWTSTTLYRETIDRALELSARQDPLMRARTRARCLAWRSVAGRWSQKDADECERAISEIEQRVEPVTIAEHRLEYTYLLSLSSRYAEADSAGACATATLLGQPSLSHYSNTLCQLQRYLVPRNLMFWGRWRQALEEVRATAAVLQNNLDLSRGQETLIFGAWIRLAAMDFPGAAAICESIVEYIRIPSVMRLWNILKGSAEAALGNSDRALEHFRTLQDEMRLQPMMDDWYQTLALQQALTELWLAKGDLARARDEAAEFLNVSLATAERTYQGLAWEANARVAIVAGEWQRAEECIAKALSAIEGYEVPLAAWRVHGTAADLQARAGNTDFAHHHCELSSTTIMKLADSLEPEDPLRATFLSAPAIRRVLDKAQGSGA